MSPGRPTARDLPLCSYAESIVQQAARYPVPPTWEVRLPAAPATTPNALRERLRRHFGFRQFRPGQLEVVRALMDGRDTLAVMPTGSGKSVCFQLPALE